MKTSTTRRIFLCLLSCLAALVASAQGLIEATMTSGKRVTELRYLRQGDTVRIEEVSELEKGPAPPVNLLDLESGDLTVFFRHNSTFERIPAARLAAKAGSAVGRPRLFPTAPGAGIPSAPGLGRLPLRSEPGAVGAPAMPGVPDFPEIPDLPPGIGPGAGDANQPAGAPGVPGISPTPAMPGTPTMPPELQSMIGGGGMPMMPPMPGMGEEPADLEKTEATRDFHGLKCTQYTMTVPREGTFEVWATDELIPFHLPTYEAPRHRGRRDFHAAWPTMLREKGLFPMLAILKDESGEREILRFEVTAYDPEKEVEDATQFQVPPAYHEVAPLPF